MFKLLIDILGIEQLLILGLALLLGVITAVIKWTLIFDFIRGGKRWE